jgi:Na+/glutamate symporter
MHGFDKLGCTLIGVFFGIIIGGALSTYSHSKAEQPTVKHCEVSNVASKKVSSVEQRIKPTYPVGTFEHEAKRTE